MEDDLKILKVEYLSNHLSDHAQILNLSFDDQTIFYKSLKWRRPPMEDDLKILKVEYLSTTKLKLRWMNHFFKSLKWRQPPMEEDLKILIVEYLSNHLLDYAQILKFS